MRGASRSPLAMRTVPPRFSSFAAAAARKSKGNGLGHADIHRDRAVVTLPGYFRPTKLWDLLVIHQRRLVAAIELSLGIVAERRVDSLNTGGALLFSQMQKHRDWWPSLFLWSQTVRQSVDATNVLRWAAATCCGPRLMGNIGATLVPYQ